MAKQIVRLCYMNYEWQFDLISMLKRRKLLGFSGRAKDLNKLTLCIKHTKEKISDNRLLQEKTICKLNEGSNLTSGLQ